MNVAVIPARGGSKRIPRKNVRPFGGKAMIVHSIDTARASGLFDRIIVCTDDEEIAQVAQDYDAEVPFRRPAELADDYAGTTEVVAHAVEWLQQRHVSLGPVCCLYATAPLVQATELRIGFERLQLGQWKFVFSATTFASPVFRGFTERADGGLEMLFPRHFRSRSQDLAECYHDAGQFYWGQPEAWARRAKIFDCHSTIVKLPRWRVQDIDTEEDWRSAEWIYEQLIQRGKDV